PAPIAVPIPTGQPVLRVALPVGHAGQLVTSAPITAWASTRTPSRRNSVSPSAIALRTVSSTAILSSAIVVFLRVVGSQSNDARMTRWPLPFSAYPLLHQVWGLHRSAVPREISRSVVSPDRARRSAR